MPKKLGEKELNILYTVLDKAKENFPQLKFTWEYHDSLGDYVLYYEGNIEQLDDYDICQLIFETCDMVNFANEFMDLTCCWLSVMKKDGIDENIEIKEVEIITNTYYHKRGERI